MNTKVIEKLVMSQNFLSSTTKNKFKPIEQNFPCCDAVVVEMLSKFTCGKTYSYN